MGLGEMRNERAVRENSDARVGEKKYRLLEARAQAQWARAQVIVSVLSVFPPHIYNLSFIYNANIWLQFVPNHVNLMFLFWAWACVLYALRYGWDAIKIPKFTGYSCLSILLLILRQNSCWCPTKSWNTIVDFQWRDLC